MIALGFVTYLFILQILIFFVLEINDRFVSIRPLTGDSISIDSSVSMKKWTEFCAFYGKMTRTLLDEFPDFCLVFGKSPIKIADQSEYAI